MLLFLPVAIFLETGLLLLNETNHGTTIQLAIVVLGLLGLMGALNLSGLRKVIAGIMLAGFLLVLLLGIFRGLSGIDVLMFQAWGAEALWHGHNPYSFRYPNVYPPNTPLFCDRDRVLGPGGYRTRARLVEPCGAGCGGVTSSARAALT